MTPRRRTALVLTLPLALGLTACTPEERPEPTQPTTADDAHADDDDAEGTEVAGPQPRVVATYDGGVLVLDGHTLQVAADLELPGFNRLAPYGDGRHVLVSTTEGAPGFRLLDTATWSEMHGDHGHHFVGEPVLTDLTFPAEAPGHAVAHGGRLALFDDGTGAATVVTLDEELGDTLPEGETLPAPAAHHGFVVPLEDGHLVTTIGTPDGGTGVRVVGLDGHDVARSEECPGVHGEGVTATGVVVVGCEDGAVVWDGTELTKVSSPDAFGRIGNQYMSPVSRMAVGDYTTDPDQGLALDRLSLLDTEEPTLEVVDLPDGVRYTWRGVGRASEGEVVVLGTDGDLHILDQRTGDVLATHAAIDPWEAPEEWQTPHPALVMSDDVAYVTSPATREVHAIDVFTGDTYATATLPAEPNEVVVVGGP